MTASGLVGESGNTQPQPGETEAVTAAAAAIDSGAAGYLIERGHIDEDDVRVIVAAAYPLIADAVLAEAERRIKDKLGLHSRAIRVVADLRRGLGENQ